MKTKKEMQMEPIMNMLKGIIQEDGTWILDENTELCIGSVEDWIVNEQPEVYDSKENRLEMAQALLAIADHLITYKPCPDEEDEEGEE
jgi:hypothetical protein